VERTVPFGFIVQTLLITWYARSGYDPADIGRRRQMCPWYRTKTGPAAADMLAKLRREFLKARFSVIQPGRGCRITRELYLSRHRPDSIKDRYVMSCMRNARTGY
jgi:hypothetical protein